MGSQFAVHAPVAHTASLLMKVHEPKPVSHM